MKFGYDLFNQLQSYGNIMKFILEGKAGKEIPGSSKSEFLEKFSVNNFALSNQGENSSGPLNRGGIVDLPLPRTPSAICQKLWEPRFWEVIDF